MAITLLIAAAAAAQTVPTDIRVAADRGGAGDRIDVAYAELSKGRTVDAVTKLEESVRDFRPEPAALINLGTAYARMGRSQEAETAYTRAITSRERYDVELADGSWIDSRQAARVALRYLDQGKVLALR